MACDELSGLSAIRTVRFEPRRVRGNRGICPAQEFDLSGLELSVPVGTNQAVVKTKGNNIQEAQKTAASNLTANALPPLTGLFPYYEDSDEIREGAEPSSETVLCQRSSVMAYQECSHLGGICIRLRCAEAKKP